MHKKLTADLISLAHSILQMKNKEDVFALKEKSHEVYEKLSVLAYVEEYINTTPNPGHTKEELLEKIEDISLEELAQKKIVEEQAEEEIVKHELEEVVENVIVEEEASLEVELDIEESTEGEVEKETVEVVEEVIEDALDEGAEKVLEEKLEEASNEIQEDNSDLFTVETETETEEEKSIPTLEEELQDTIAVDVVADLFENAPKKSLNDKLQGDIQIGLNDRIAFVKNLFGGSQEDFNRVISQLNTLKTEKEAKKFINKMVKPDYNWTDKEEFENRFMDIVERKFL